MIAKLIEKLFLGTICFLVIIFIAAMVTYSILTKGHMERPKP